MGNIVWKDIPGYSRYEVSILGIRRKSDGGFMSIHLSDKGYKRNFLIKDGEYGRNGKKRWFLVHRIIAESFIPNPENHPDVNHINGIKTDNRIENLEWVSKRQNAKHAMDCGLSKVKLNQEKANEIRTKFIPRKYTIPMLAKEYGVCEETIESVMKKETWNY